MKTTKEEVNALHSELIEPVREVLKELIKLREKDPEAEYLDTAVILHMSGMTCFGSTGENVMIVGDGNTLCSMFTHIFSSSEEKHKTLTEIIQKAMLASTMVKIKDIQVLRNNPTAS